MDIILFAFVVIGAIWYIVKGPNPFNENDTKNT